MEKIIYCKTLDVHKNGVQFLLQGFETADKVSRIIEISLMASGDAIDLPLEGLVAMMYVTTPNATEPSINKCTIKDNKIIYEVLPITEEGITELKLKLIETSPKGATSVLASPKFSVEVTESGMNDDGEELNKKFTATAIEDFIAKADAAYRQRLVKIELDSECIFKAYYADGTYYENSLLKELFTEGNVLLSESFAHGGTGVRAGEDKDNSMYYSNVAKAEAQNAKAIMENSEEILQEVKLHGVYTAFSIDFNTGEAVYVSPSFKFTIDTKSGELNAENHQYVFNDYVGRYVEHWLATNGIVISDLQKLADNVKRLESRITPIENGGTGADNVNDARTNLEVYSKEETASKTTLELFGLTSENLPNDILKMLGSYWWRRRSKETGYALDIGTEFTSWFNAGTAYDAKARYEVSDSITYDEAGNIILDNPDFVYIYMRDVPSYNSDKIYKIEALKGKYFRDKATDGYSKIDDNVVLKGSDDGVSAYYSSLYPGRLEFRGVTKHTSKYYEINGEYEYMYSTNKDEYPTGINGGFEYESLGVPYVNAIHATIYES